MIQARFTQDEAGLVVADLGMEWAAFNEVLADGIESRAPVGEPPGLSTYWVDRALDRLSVQVAEHVVIVEGNGTELLCEGDRVVARSLYDAFSEQSMPMDDFREVLREYRDRILSAMRT